MYLKQINVSLLFVPLLQQEYQNRLCGWSGKDTGERVYGGNIPIKKLYKEISKLNYPFLNRNIERIGNKNRIR